MPTDATVQQLNRLGWRVTDGASFTRAVKDFQRGYALPGVPALLVDGKAGPKTRAAIAASDTRRRRGEPTASRFYSFSEFRCKCGGRYSGCAVIRVHRELLIGLGRICEVTKKKAVVVSGYRCPTRNAKVGGASLSEHVDGCAADVAYVMSTLACRRLRVFSGIGQKGGKVRHVDVRHVSGSNKTGGTPAQPTIWVYG